MGEYRWIDQNAGRTRQGYKLVRVARTLHDTVRVRVERDSYDFQSYAIAEVLNSDRKWTPVAEDAPSNWHDSTPGSTPDVAFVLGPIVERLMERADAILQP